MPLQPTNLPTSIAEKDLGHIGDTETAHAAINELTSTAGADRVGTADGSTVQEALAAQGSAISARPTSADLAAPGGAGLIGSSLPGGNVAAVLAALSGQRLSGTGVPSVAAPVGTTYVDLNATNGAVLWIKASGTGTSGWQVLWGDTGWRDVTPTPLPSTMVSGQIFIRRVGGQVSLWMQSVRWAAASPPFNVLPAPAPMVAGFWQPAYTRAPVSLADGDAAFHDWLLAYYGGGGLLLRLMHRLGAGGFVNPIPATPENRPLSGGGTWQTVTPWPSTLPGT